MTVMDALVTALAAHPEKTPSDVISEAVGLDGLVIERRLLDYAVGCSPAPAPMTCSGCGWNGLTRSTHCGSCGQRLIMSGGAS